MKLKSHASALALGSAMSVATAGAADAWTLEEAAKPYAGTELEVLFLDRPGYAAAEKMLPEFEAATGIKVNFTTVPYENALGEQVRDFVAGGDLDIALIDLEENVRMMSRVVGVSPDEVKIGMPVKAAIEIENDQPLVVFRNSEVAS